MTVLPRILLILNPYILLPHKAPGFVLLPFFFPMLFYYSDILLLSYFLCVLWYTSDKEVHVPHLPITDECHDCETNFSAVF